MMKTILKKRKDMVFVLTCAMPFTLNLISTNYLIENTSFIDFLIFTKYLIVFFLVINIILDIIQKKFSKLELFIIMLVFIIFGYLIYTNSDFEFKTGDEHFIYFLAIVACMEINYKRLIRGLFISNLAFLIVLSIFTLLYIVLYYYDIEGTTRVRFRMGKHPNSFAYIWIYLVFVYIYININRIKAFDFAILFIINLILFYLLGTKSVFLVTNLYFLLVVIVKYFKISLMDYSWYKVLIAVFPFLCFAIVFLWSYFYAEDVWWMAKANEILNGRLSFAHNAIRYSGFRLFENDMQYRFQKGDYYVDFSIIMFLIRYGLIMFIVLMAFLTYFGYQIALKKDVYMSIVFLLFILFTSFNDDFFNIVFNILLFVPSYKSYAVSGNKVSIGK